MKLKKGDLVKVLIGKDKGRTGKIEKVIPKKSQVVVAGINVYKKHIKAREGQKGGIVEINKPLHISKVALVCPKCNQAARVGWLIDKNGEKYRVCKKCQEII
jgi:large subunit ribosomal protein L24